MPNTIDHRIGKATFSTLFLKSSFIVLFWHILIMRISRVPEENLSRIITGQLKWSARIFQKFTRCNKIGWTSWEHIDNINWKKNHCLEIHNNQMDKILICFIPELRYFVPTVNCRQNNRYHIKYVSNILPLHPTCLHSPHEFHFQFIRWKNDLPWRGKQIQNL